MPTLDAWHIESEPWLFGVDGAGTIQSRIDGAFGGTEMKALLDALVGKQSERAGTSSDAGAAGERS